MCTYSPKFDLFGKLLCMQCKYRPTSRPGRSNSNAKNPPDLSRFTKYSIFTVDLFYIIIFIIFTYQKLELRPYIVTIYENFSQAPKRHFTSRKELQRTDQNSIAQYITQPLLQISEAQCKFKHNILTDSSVKMIRGRRISDPHPYLDWNLSGGIYSLHRFLNY